MVKVLTSQLMPGSPCQTKVKSLKPEKKNPTIMYNKNIDGEN